MRTDRDPSDVVGVGVELKDLNDGTVASTLLKHQAESSETQRLILVVTADCPRFTVIAISTKSARVLGTRARDARDRALAEALWLTTSDEGGIDAGALTASFERVISTRKPDAMPLRRCHLTHPAARSSSEPARWWSVINFPMLGTDGRVTHIVQRIEDVTGTAQMQLAHDAWLPAIPEAAIGTASLPRALLATDISNPVLLMVATDEHDRDRLRASFDDYGYRVFWAHSEQDTLAVLAQQRPDCVVLDLSSPNLGGLRICRAIRERPTSAETAIICLSPRRDAAVLDRALLAGADEVLEKSIKPHELMQHVQAALMQQPGMTEPLRAHCRNLRQQRMRLFRLQLQRERVASYIVHDLKEPLSTIDLRAALLLATDLPGYARSQVERMRTQVRSALLQVLNLLDIRMLDEGRLEARCEPVDLFRMVRELLTDFDAKAQTRSLTLRSDVEVAQVVADPDLLRRVLANLLDNAVRHAPNDSEVAVTAHRIAGARVELRVLNAGPSIPSEMTDRIFEAFVQVDANSAACRNRDGRGLGLAFCKLAVEAHRGEISVIRIRGQTVFSIKLPENYQRSDT